MEANNATIVTEVVYRGFLCKMVDDKGWKIVMGQSEYLFPSLHYAKRAIDGMHEDCVKKYWGAKLTTNALAKESSIQKTEPTRKIEYDESISLSTRKKKKEKKRHPFLFALIVLFALVILGSSTSSTETPAATSTPTKKPVVTSTPTATPAATPTTSPTATPMATPTATPTTVPTATPTATPTTIPTATPTATPTTVPTATPTATPTTIPTAAPTATPTAVPTTTPTASPTNTPAPTPEETAFTVEHDEEYDATQEYIYKFLTEKGYEVQVIIGVPNIGRYEDDDPNDSYVNWYAYVKRNGVWQEFVIVLFNGEVSFIRPNK